MSRLPSVLITGALGEVGKALAAKFASNGETLLLIDKDVEENKSQIERMGLKNYVLVSADVSSESDWSKLEKRDDFNLSELKVAVLAAGIEGPITEIENISHRDFSQVMDVNVTGVWLGMRTCLRQMKKRRDGTVLVVSSISGRSGARFLSAYSASKHAIIGLARSAARESMEHGVRINAIAPGPIRSSMMQRINTGLSKKSGSSSSSQDVTSQDLTSQKYVSVEEVVELCYFLCSPSGRGCNGGVFAVDNGLSVW